MEKNRQLWKLAFAVLAILTGVASSTRICQCALYSKPCSVFAGGKYVRDGSKCVYKPRLVTSSPGSRCDNWQCDLAGSMFCNITYYETIDGLCNPLEIIVVQPTTLPNPPPLQAPPTATPTPSKTPSPTPEPCIATTLSPADVAQMDGFGTTLEINRDLLVIGAPLRDVQASKEAGVAYVYRRAANGTWIQEAKFAPQGANLTLNHFGQSVSVNTNRIIVGANGDGTGKLNSGSAYFFYYHSGVKRWYFHSKVTANSTGMAGDMFGDRVAISSSGQWALVSAHRDMNSGTISGEGSVYVYNLLNNTWNLMHKLTPPSIDRGEVLEYGSAIALSGAMLVIGARGRESSRGAVYFYYRDGTEFHLRKVFVAPDGKANDGFGSSIALNPLVLVVGAPKANSNAGAAYVFRRDRLGQLLEKSPGTKLYPADLVQGDEFGLSVGVSYAGDGVTVGAPGQLALRGAVYSYHWNGSNWSLEKKFVPSNSDDINAGRSTFTSGTHFMFGVRGRNSLMDRVELQCVI